MALTKRRKNTYRFIGIGSAAIIIALSAYFNWPNDAQTHAVNQIAPEFVQITVYLNTPPVDLHSLYGKVVWIHFWRIGCPSCADDIPFVNQMFAKYKSYGLTVIGMHSAQFDYEQAQLNVQNFVKDHHIAYPVLLDSTGATFKLYGDAYYPRDVLVDAKGYITWGHVGADDNYQREMAIRNALSIRNY